MDGDPKMVGDTTVGVEENSERAQSQGRGDKTMGSFFVEHPGLIDEMNEMGAPLEPEEFQREGFKLVRYKEDGKDGEIHVQATTPEYKAWQEGGEQGKRPQHYEGLDDRRERERSELLTKRNGAKREIIWDDINLSNRDELKGYLEKMGSQGMKQENVRLEVSPR